MISEIRARKIKNLKNVMVRIISAPFSWGAFWVIMSIMVLLIALYLYKRKHWKGPIITVKKVHSVLASDGGENYIDRKREEFLRRGNYYAGPDSLQNMFYVLEVFPEAPVTRGPVVEETVIEETPVSICEYPRVPINWDDSIVEEIPETIVEETPEAITEEAPKAIVEQRRASIVKQTPVSIVEQTDEEAIDTSIFSEAHESFEAEEAEEAVEEPSIVIDASLLSDVHEAVEAEEAEEAVEEDEVEGTFEVVEKEDVVGGLRRKVRIYNNPKEESDVVDGVELMDGDLFRPISGAVYGEYEYNE
ncbi:hypothetical protein NERG_00360 [Nematocida ausubeli]|uniref:Uncharacterized protein n=1 Tax=Nematocida ausubeli (strain ATCC PRA-371 / ERTm2) TaxID=1913371 RepID=H8Z9T9_NEMA1|nr:hypothetical protein NERG_00360 [Nematocida ausubeli]